MFGTIRPLTDSNAQVAAAFVIDDSSPSFYVYPQVAQDINQVTFFVSPPLSDGIHELEVVVAAASQDNAFYFDYLGVVPETAHESASQDYITSPLSEPTSTVFVTQMTEEHRTPLGPIIGGVLGGMAILLGAIFAFWFVFRRHRRGRAYFYRRVDVSEMLEDGMWYLASSDDFLTTVPELRLTDIPTTVEPFPQSESSGRITTLRTPPIISRPPPASGVGGPT